MTNCKDCIFYNEENDNNHRSGQDVIIVGKEPPDNHFCYAFEPIPNGVFEGERNCDKFLPKMTGQ